MSIFDRELSAAITAVRAASLVTSSVRAEMTGGHTMTKSDRSPVTVADFASQAVVCRLLSAACPEIPVVGEEAADELRKPESAALAQMIREHVEAGLGQVASEAQVLDWIDLGGANVAAGSKERFWTLDPIDGTKGFLRGDQYVVALALIEAGEVVAGVLGCPYMPVDADQAEGPRGILMAAARGQGTWMLPVVGDEKSRRRVHVSPQGDSRLARFCEPVETEHADQGKSAAVASALGMTAMAVRMDSQAKYAAVSRGQAEIYMRLPTSATRRECIWDHAAGTIVVQEAGGRVSDIRGQPLDFGQGKKLEKNWGILATNGTLHDAVVRAVGSVMG